MKNLICIIITLFIYTVSFSQSFTVTELEKISKYNWDDFDTFVINKNYIYDDEKTIENVSQSKTYAYKPTNYDTRAQSWISLRKLYDVYYRMESSVSWQTVKQIDYINIKY